MTFLNSLFGNIIRFFCELCGNSYALGILVFTVIINVVLIPLNIKQQKSSAAQARLQNKLAKLKEKYGDNREKYQEEMSKLYSQNGSSPMTGCLLLFIRLPIFICIYTAVRQCLTYICGTDAALIKDATAALGNLIKDKNVAELTILKEFIGGNPKLAGDAFKELTNGYNFDFTLFGLNLLDMPAFGNIAPIWIVPGLSFLTSLLSAFISMNYTKKTNPDAGASGATNGCMLIFMPLFSLYITFKVPGAVGWYWVCSNVISMLISVFTQQVYFPGKIIAQIEAKEAKKRRAYEATVIHPETAVKNKKSGKPKF